MESRLDDMREAGVTDFGLPELHRDEYLVDMMYNLAPIRFVASAPAPTDWDIIAPFSQAVGLDHEDQCILVDMCRGFFEALQSGKNALAIAPVEQGE